MKFRAKYDFVRLSQWVETLTLSPEFVFFNKYWVWQHWSKKSWSKLKYSTKDRFASTNKLLIIFLLWNHHNISNVKVGQGSFCYMQGIRSLSFPVISGIWDVQ